MKGSIGQNPLNGHWGAGRGGKKRERKEAGHFRRPCLESQVAIVPKERRTHRKIGGKLFLKGFKGRGKKKKLAQK